MSEKVLYMEDDAAQARLVQRCLERAGYDVDLVQDGVAGLDACATHDYDAVIVDQTMPGLSGLDVIHRLIERGPLPPIIMVTGTGSERIAVEAMKLGAKDYLVKDLESGFINVLPLVVGRVVEQRRLLCEKKRIEKQLVQAQRMEAIGQLAAGIAHEINTPTQYIGDNTRFLQHAFDDLDRLLEAVERLLDAQRNGRVTKELLQEIEYKFHEADFDYLNREIPLAIQQSLEGIEHVANIVGAMKEFSYPGNGVQQAVDLNHVIEGAVTLCRSEWKYVADVVTDFDTELPPVTCNPTDLNRVILNLVVNAAHAIAEVVGGKSTAKGTITIHTIYDDPFVEIRVQDTGAGIPKDIRSRVFDLFFTTKDVGIGTGQGLALAHAIVVEKHGGTICFETEVGRGTTFIVRLPIHGRIEGDQESGEPASMALQAV